MNIEDELLGIREDLGDLSATVRHLAAAVGALTEAVKGLEEAGVQVKIDIARWRGTLAGAVVVLGTLATAVAWVWDRFLIKP